MKLHTQEQMGTRLLVEVANRVEVWLLFDGTLWLNEDTKKEAWLEWKKT